MPKSRHHTNLMETWIQICFTFICCLELVSPDRHLCFDEPDNSTQFTKVCDSVLINSTEDLREFSQCGCSVIDGSLHIRNQLDVKGEFLGETSFQALREVREFILIEKVPGTINLTKLFPNLLIVRGETLISQHSIVVLESNGLVNGTTFSSLRYITRGSIFLNGFMWIPSTNSCGVNQTFQLTQRRRMKDFHKKLKREFECSGKMKDCSSNCTENCNHLKQCCHSECLSGCHSANDPKSCFACRNVLQDTECKKSCSYDRFQLHHLCVPYQHCVNKGMLIVNQTKQCLDGPLCPSGFRLQGSHCDPCDKGEKCPKTCPGMRIRTLNQAADLKGCEIVSGSLSINIDKVEGLTSKLLEFYMSNLKEVHGFVRVNQTYLSSLDFLKSLRIIKGQELFRNRYALVVDDNLELESIFNSSSSKFDHILSIEKGDILFRSNSRLCPAKIWAFVDSCDGPNITRLSQGVSGADNGSFTGSKMISDHHKLTQRHLTTTNTSNGSSGPCKVLHLNISVEPYPEERGRVTIYHDPVNHPLFAGNVSFLVFFKKVKPNSDLFIEQSSSSCFHEWSTIERVFDESDPHENKDISISGLESDSRYMFHITAHPESRNGNVIKAESGLVDIVTPFYNPSPPINVKGYSNRPFTLDVSWDSPDDPNSNIDHYMVLISRMHITQPNNHRNANFSSNVAQRKFRDLMRSQSGSFANQQKFPSSEKCRELEKTSLSFDNERNETRQPSCSCGSNNVADNEGAEMIYFCQHESNQFEKTTFISNLLNHHQSKPVKPTEIKHNETLTIKDGEQGILVYGKSNTSFRDLQHPGLYKIRVSSCEKPVPCVKFDSFAPDNSTADNWNKTDNATQMNQLCKLCSLYSEAGVAVVKRSASRDFSLWIRNNTKESERGVELFWNSPRDLSAVSPFFVYYVEFRNEETQTILPSSYVGHTLGATNQSALFKDLPTGRYLSQVSVINMDETLNMTTGWVSFYYLDRKYSREILMTEILKAVIIVELLLAVLSYIVWRRYKKNRSKIPKGRFDLPHLPAKFDKLILSKDQIEINEDKLLGTGQFGKVFEAVLKIGEEKAKVAVKVPTMEGKYSDTSRFMKEADLMQSISSQHVVKLIGILPDKSQFMIVMELMGNRDLKTFLKENQKKPRANNPLSNTRLLIRMACEAADGLEYLSSKLNLVHRDVAARNCLVSDENSLKIADLGIAGPPDPVGHPEVYKRLMPVRWMAPESLKYNIFTTKTDVWSYGILLWEIVTAGKTPYEGYGHEQVAINVVDKGSSLEIPPLTTPSYADVMTACWKYDPKRRPSFSEIFNYLIQFLEREERAALVAVSSCYHQEELSIASVSCQNESTVNTVPIEEKDSGFGGQCSNFKLTGSNAQNQMGREQGSLNRIYCNFNAPENSAQRPLSSNDAYEATPTLSVDALSQSCQINSFQLEEMPASKPIDFRLKPICFPNECSITCPDRRVLSKASSSGESWRNPCLNNNEPKIESAVDLTQGKKPKSKVLRLTESITANISPFHNRSRASCELTPFKTISKLKDSYNCSNSKARYSDYSCESESSVPLISPVESLVPFYYCQCPAETDKSCSHPIPNSVFAMSCAGGQNLRCEYNLVENKKFKLHLQSHYNDPDSDTETVRSLLLDENTNVEV